MTFTYDEAKKYLIEHLSRDADLHIVEESFKIGEGFEIFDQNLPRTDDTRFTKLHIALNFWDGWQDARNHKWRYYEGIAQNDWPELAKIIVQNLQHEQEITNQKILKHFDLQPKRGKISA